jgi:hypothetical protein
MTKRLAAIPVELRNWSGIEFARFAALVSAVAEGRMNRRASLEAIWAEIHEFTERQNSSSKIRSNRRSISLAPPITFCLAIVISMGGLLWLLGGGTLWLIFKTLFKDAGSVASLRRRKHPPSPTGWGDENGLDLRRYE